jgi:hypothetical protein
MATTMHRPVRDRDRAATKPRRRRVVPFVAATLVVAGLAATGVSLASSSRGSPERTSVTTERFQDPLITRFGVDHPSLEADQDPLVTRFGINATTVQESQDPLVTRFGR